MRLMCTYDAQVEDMLAYHQGKRREAELAAALDRLNAAQGNVRARYTAVSACQRLLLVCWLWLASFSLPACLQALACAPGTFCLLAASSRLHLPPSRQPLKTHPHHSTHPLQSRPVTHPQVGNKAAIEAEYEQLQAQARRLRTESDKKLGALATIQDRVRLGGGACVCVAPVAQDALLLLLFVVGEDACWVAPR
jgi:hypothetical protein